MKETSFHIFGNSRLNEVGERRRNVGRMLGWLMKGLWGGSGGTLGLTNSQVLIPISCLFIAVIYSGAHVHLASYRAQVYFRHR